jgi:hypothetical protein
MEIDHKALWTEVDIDYILEWVRPAEPGGHFSFWVSPATVVFPDPTDVVVNVDDVGPFLELEIDSMTRRPAEDSSGATNLSRWTIEGSFNLELTASGYSQHIRMAPRMVDHQALSPEQRGGVSFATAGYR